MRSTSEANAILSRARDKDSQIAVDRYDAIKPYLGEDPPPITKVNRSIRHFFGVEAKSPEFSQFQWKDFYVRLLQAINEPLIDKKIDYQDRKLYLNL